MVTSRWPGVRQEAFRSTMLISSSGGTYRKVVEYSVCGISIGSNTSDPPSCSCFSRSNFSSSAGIFISNTVPSLSIRTATNRPVADPLNSLTTVTGQRQLEQLRESMRLQPHLCKSHSRCSLVNPSPTRGISICQHSARLSNTETKITAIFVILELVSVAGTTVVTHCQQI